MNKLICWNTPFTNTSHPSVGLFLQHGEDETDLVTAIVAPHGIDAYPKYLVSFGTVIEFNCYEEGFAPDHDYETAEVEINGLSAYEWIDSPSIEAYECGLPHVASKDCQKLHHYILFGGDNIVEIVTENMPEIEIVNESRKIYIELKV